MDKIEQYKKIVLKITLIAFIIALIFFRQATPFLPMIPLFALRENIWIDINIAFYAGIVLDVLLLISGIFIILSALHKSNYSRQKILEYILVALVLFLVMQFLVKILLGLAGAD